MKTLNGGCVVEIPARQAATFNEGKIGISFNEMSATTLSVQLFIGKTTDNVFNYMSTKNITISGTNLTNIQSELNAFVAAVWDELKDMEEVDFE